MRLPLNLFKLLAVFWPLFALMALAVAVNPAAWAHISPATALVLASPLILIAVVAALRERWWLELTPDALIHHALFRQERFLWERMGPVELRLQHILHLPLARTFWFAYAPEHGPAVGLRTGFGRRLLDVFGDRSGRETLELIAAYRASLTFEPRPYDAP